MFERILIVRLSALGDVVLATPALRALRARFPQAKIDWLVEKAYAEVLAGHPHLERVIAYDKHGEHHGPAGLLHLRKQLRERHYGLVIDLQHKPKTVALCGSLGAERVLALHKRTRGQTLIAALGRERPLTRVHAADLYLELLAQLDVAPAGAELEVCLCESARAPAAALGEGTGWVGLAPGARWATKRWDAERFAELGNRLAAQGHPILLLGGPGDCPAIEAVRARLTAPPVADTIALSVGGLMGAIARCQAIVAGDSGPVHLASALGIPVAVLFGPTSPRRWAPRTSPHRSISAELVCSPCSNHGGARCPIGTHACMKEISVDEVEAAVHALLTPHQEAQALAR